MSTAGFFIAYFSNFKGNLFNLDKKDKINNLKIDVIMNNIVKARGDDNSDSLNNKSDSRRENKRKRKPCNKKDNNRSEKV